MSDFDKVLAEKLADPEFRRAFEDAGRLRALDDLKADQ